MKIVIVGGYARSGKSSALEALDHLMGVQVLSTSRVLDS